ncbi:MAG TPA: PAS domain-containing protein [Mesorhizobium sp.]|jgi:PAS domain S-box-containing protein|nr:PAS domain-containing protein [Mesorhizobium sp.]
MADETPGPSFKGDPPAAAKETVLPDRRELALVAVERTRMPMVVSDPRQPDTPIVLANHAFLELTGYTPDEVIGRNCRFLQGPETNPGDVDAIRQGLATNSDHFEVELLNYRKDGSAFWNQLSISPVRDEAGELIYYFGSQKDVTARRRAEELEAIERLLLKEVDHRAMNALAIVQSIVSLSRTDSIARYAASVRGRVEALARAHRLLAQSGWAGADLNQLMTAEMMDAPRGRVAAGGPSLRVPAPLVQPLALVVHELAANAVQHGALAVPAGVVKVRWAEEAGRILLEWQESGARNVKPPSESGFGLRILHGLIERQLGGKVKMSWDSEGLGAELRVPMKSAVRTGPGH